jgi:hypothetical protein
VIIHEAGVPGQEYGDRPILVEKDHNCAECRRVHDIEKCPKCGAPIFLGYGLGFGPGVGEYKACDGGCDWSWKRCDPEEA